MLLRRVVLMASFLVFVALGAGVMTGVLDPAGDPALWLQDLERLKAHMAGAYANLEWAARRRGLDLAESAQATAERLRSARSAKGARRALQEFVESFGDPHFKVAPLGKTPPPPPADRPDPGFSSSLTAAQACAMMGYGSRDLDFRLRLDSLAGFTRLPDGDNPFAAGLLRLKDDRRVGFLRIAHFGEDGYLDVALAEWDAWRPTAPANCDSGCRYTFQVRVADRLLAHVASRIRELQAAGMQELVVDVTGNGGGTDWSAMTARILTKRKLACTSGAVVRHPHHGTRARSMIGEVDEDLARPGLTDGARRALEAARVRLVRFADELDHPCDRMPLWEMPGATVACSQLTTPSAACGLLEQEPADPLEGVESRKAIWSPLRYRFEEGLYDGPLWIAIDDRSASATEGFVSMLQAAGAATLVGERTYGAGCGYIGGGIPLSLEHAGLLVKMPDCVRYRADGGNELDGIAPDVTGWEPGASWANKTRGLIKALEQGRPAGA